MQTVLGVLPKGPLGGGRVMRSFNMLNPETGKLEPQRMGKELSVAEIGRISTVNLRAMVEKGILQVWPAAPAPAVPANAERHVVQVGFGRHVHYDVIEGVRVNDHPLSKEEAEALAGIKTEAAA